MFENRLHRLIWILVTISLNKTCTINIGQTIFPLAVSFPLKKIKSILRLPKLNISGFFTKKTQNKKHKMKLVSKKRILP